MPSLVRDASRPITEVPNPRFLNGKPGTDFKIFKRDISVLCRAYRRAAHYTRECRRTPPAAVSSSSNRDRRVRHSAVERRHCGAALASTTNKKKVLAATTPALNWAPLQRPRLGVHRGARGKRPSPLAAAAAEEHQFYLVLTLADTPAAPFFIFRRYERIQRLCHEARTTNGYRSLV